MRKALTIGRNYDSRERELEELQAAEDKKDPHQQNCCASATNFRFHLLRKNYSPEMHIPTR